MPTSGDERTLLLEVLAHYRTESDAGPDITLFRANHPGARTQLDALQHAGYLTADHRSYLLTESGLIECGTQEAKEEASVLNDLLRVLKLAYQEAPRTRWAAAEIGRRLGLTERRTSQLITRLRAIAGSAFSQLERDAGGNTTACLLAEAVLDSEPIHWPESASPSNDSSDSDSHPRIVRLEISGYRPFLGFSAELGDLTVIIGANATGKSSLFDLIRLLSLAVSNPLPPEIDPTGIGRRVFHVGHPERIEIGLVVHSSQRKPLRYELEIMGPQGAPRVVRERLMSTEPWTEGESKPFVFLDFHNGKGVVRDPVERKRARPDWTVPPNELALRRALDPTLTTVSAFREMLAAWRVYADLDVSPASAMRRAVPSEPNPVLTVNGSNLSAVLSWLITEHPEAREELETQLRAAIPGFTSIGAKAWGGPGTWIGTWRESGIEEELMLTDLSDGTLRLLCLAVLCLSPNIPPLLCIDEPELGLHPRVLPMLAGLLRSAAARCQVLVATHSPYLLAQLSLDEIAVMRKEDGRAVFARPANSAALRSEVEEMGGTVLAQLHISDELEGRS
jgi:predicted ATPase